MSERILVQFEYDAESHERDPSDASGLTEQAYISLMDGIRSLGGSDIEITAQ